MSRSGNWLRFRSSFSRPDIARNSRSRSEEPRGSAQLPDLGAYSLPARRDQPEMRQYFFESEKDGMPFSRDTARWSISAPRCSSTSGRSAPRRTSTGKATNGCTIRWRRRRMPARNSALPSAARIAASRIRLPSSTFRDELRRAQSQRGARAECRCEKGRLRPRHRRGRCQPLSRENGGDIIWEIGSGILAAATATAPSIRNCLRRSPPTTRSRWSNSRSARAPAGHGGVLPAAKVSEEISKIRGVAMDEDCISPAYHKAFRRRWK